MGKKQKCPQCKRQFKDSKKQKIKRRAVMMMLKGIKTAGINEVDEKTKKFCHECWKKELRSYVKPYAQALGKTVEDW